MGQITQTSVGTGLGLNAIPVFTDAQPVDVSAGDYVWQVNGADPVVAQHVPTPYVENTTTGFLRLLPFKLKLSQGAILDVKLEGMTTHFLMPFSEGENNQMVIKVFNNVLNDIDGSTDGDIVAFR